MALALVKPWTTQPYGAAPAINWRSGLTKNLALLNYGFSDNDLVTGGDWVWTAGTNPVATQYGMGRRLTSASSQWGRYDTPWAFDAANFSFMAVCIPLTASGAQGIVAITSPTDSARIQINFGFTASKFNILGSATTGPASNFSYTLNMPQVAVATRFGTLSSLYLPRKDIAANTFSIGGAGSYTSAQIGTRLVSGVAGSFFNGIILFAAFWRRALSFAEAVSLTDNPWQLFRGVETLSAPTYYPILSNLQATRGNTSAALRTNINY